MPVTLRDATQIIAMVERGDLAQDFTAEIETVIRALQDEAGPKREVKGSATLKLNFTVQGVSITIGGEISSKTPKKRRSNSVYFLTADGRISTEHPEQPDMFPQDAEKRKRV